MVRDIDDGHPLLPKMPDQREQRLRTLAESSPNAWIDQRRQAYLIPIDDLQPQH